MAVSVGGRNMNENAKGGRLRNDKKRDSWVRSNGVG